MLILLGSLNQLCQLLIAPLSSISSSLDKTQKRYTDENVEADLGPRGNTLGNTTSFGGIVLFFSYAFFCLNICWNTLLLKFEY